MVMNSNSCENVHYRQKMSGRNVCLLNVQNRQKEDYRLLVENFNDLFQFLHFNVPFQVRIETEDKAFKKGRYKKLVGGTVMGGDMVVFYWWGEYHSTPPYWKTVLLRNFLVQSDTFASFIKNSSRKGLPFEFIFCMSAQHHD